MNVFIGDSSELILNGLNTILQSHVKDIKISSFFNHKDLKNSIKEKSVSLLLIDYTSKGFSLDKLIDLKNKYPNLLILAITPYSNAQTIVQAVKGGVESHVKKECSIKEILDAFDATIRGKKFFCADIIKQMRSESINIKKLKFKSFKIKSIDLSDRELQIVKFIAEGYTNSQIAAIVYLSNHTINTHRKNIMKKLGVNNTAGIVMYAVKTGMVSPSQFSFTNQDDE